jgi:hypothetical protein
MYSWQMPSASVFERIVALLLMFCAVGIAQSPSPERDQLISMEARGRIGPYGIGFNYTVRHNTELVSAHYFYVTQLKDIPLNGTVRGEDVELKGEDNSAFALHFVGNGSNGKDPLTFYNSVGLSGFWTLGSRTLPVDLRFQHSTENPGTRLYVQVTDQPDWAYEAMVSSVKQAILKGDVAEVAKHTEFPLKVNGTHKSLTIHNATELMANWSKIFTPEFLAKLGTDVPHEMFVHGGEAMLGDGELWFDDKGLVSLNPVLGRPDLIKDK